MTSLRDVVDVVIGVDTDVHTHSAAAVDARTGAVLGEITVEATADGYERLVEFADDHVTLRAWAIEGTGGHGAGLANLLLHEFGQNQIWCALVALACELTAWMQMLALAGHQARRWEPNGSATGCSPSPPGSSAPAAASSPT